MPQLTYLRLRGNKITNVGLLAILDGCPHLKWLHILQCPYLNLEGYEIHCVYDIDVMSCVLRKLQYLPFVVWNLDLPFVVWNCDLPIVDVAVASWMFADGSID
ncbi:hypothetical protein Lal_00021750 [Lupinus albus]|nr:hypothetical protein Lal_00021678 [Lupinus albus]KAF1865750.1 hypothetical protein Lal_00021750 [Lupinus albus]